jgi:hypothetical protein
VLRDKKWNMIIAYKEKTMAEVLELEHVAKIDGLVKLWVSV